MKLETPEANYFFTLPSDFNAKDFLPHDLRRHSHNANYFVDSLRNRMILSGNCEPVTMYSPYLKRMMGDNYASIVKSLIDGGAVDRSKSYKVGEQSYRYVLNERFIDSQFVSVPVTNKPMRKRIESRKAELAAIQTEWRLPVHESLARSQELNLRIHGHSSRDLLSRVPGRNPYDSQGRLVSRIEERDFRLTIGRTGRVYNNITSMLRELRKMLTINGHPLASVDIRCAQPALLGLLIQCVTGNFRFPKTHNIRGRGSFCPSFPSLPSFCGQSSFSSYLSHVTDGSLYEHIGDRMQSGMPRDDLKHRILVDVFGKRGSYNSIVENAFSEAFPDVHSYIRKVNCDGQRPENMIRLLQRIESFVVIETVCARLFEVDANMPVVTLHDAIYATPDRIEFVEEVFDEIFTESGFKLSLAKTLPSCN